MDSLLLGVVRRAHVLVARPILRRLPPRLRRLLVRELSVDLSPAGPAESAMTHAGSEPTGLPVLPSSPAEDLHLAYLKGFLLDRMRGRQTRDTWK